MKFIDCEIRDARFTKADFTQVSFVNCDLGQGVFVENNVSEVNFVNCTLIGTDFSKANLANANFPSAGKNRRRDFGRSHKIRPHQIGEIGMRMHIARFARRRFADVADCVEQPLVVGQPFAIGRDIPRVKLVYLVRIVV